MIVRDVQFQLFLFSGRDNRSNPYGMLCSERLGRRAYKEKFVYFYRSETQVQTILCVVTFWGNQCLH